MNWDERYQKEAGAISDFVTQHAIPFYQQHIVPVERAIWPDPGAIEHDVRFNMYRKIPGTPEWGMDQGARHVLRTIKNKVHQLRSKLPGTEEATQEQ